MARHCETELDRRRRRQGATEPWPAHHPCRNSALSGRGQAVLAMNEPTRPTGALLPQASNGTSVASAAPRGQASTRQLRHVSPPRVESGPKREPRQGTDTSMSHCQFMSRPWVRDRPAEGKGMDNPSGAWATTNRARPKGQIPRRRSGRLRPPTQHQCRAQAPS